jgi:ribosomal protein S12 methylthiotransferase
MSVKVGMICLGCAKNQVDGEMLMAALRNGGFETVSDPAESDIAIINTCGFIDSAKKESIGEILDLVDLKNDGVISKIVVTGCLAERYKDEIRRDIPEVDAVLGIGANADIVNKFKELCDGEAVESFPDKYQMPLCGDRDLSTPNYFAYLKIAEGCDNNCTYCAIPMIRGKQRSRTIENIMEEAENLVANGVKELIVIAQDTSRYGIDIYGEYSLAKLLKSLATIENLKWIRVLYCYPEAITEELIDVFASEDKVVKYLDLPLQHASGRVLKRMNRRGDREKLTKLINTLRERIPGIILRSTFIAGFPGETEEDFTELAEFVKEMEFDRMGCFAYSQEEGTPAARMKEQLDEETKEDRARIIMEMQMDIMDRINRRHIGKKLEVMVEGWDEDVEAWFGRSYMDAPDVDGFVYFNSDNDYELGDFVMVEIEDATDADLYGSEVSVEC